MTYDKIIQDRFEAENMEWNAQRQLYLKTQRTNPVNDTKP
jgi:hypothetical protein